MQQNLVKSKLILTFILFSSMTILTSNTKYGKAFIDQDDVISQGTRNQIYNIIKNNDGIHFREICRQLNKKMGVIQYHLSVLEKNNYIKSVKNGRYKCFFSIKNDSTIYNPIQYLSFKEKEIRQNIITAIKCNTAQNIIKYLKNNGETSHKTLSELCSISPQAITFHCQRLEKMNIIESKKIGRQKIYFLNQNILKILNLIQF